MLLITLIIITLLRDNSKGSYRIKQLPQMLLMHIKYLKYIHVTHWYCLYLLKFKFKFSRYASHMFVFSVDLICSIYMKYIYYFLLFMLLLNCIRTKIQNIICVSKMNENVLGNRTECVLKYVLGLHKLVKNNF